LFSDDGLTIYKDTIILINDHLPVWIGIGFNNAYGTDKRYLLEMVAQHFQAGNHPVIRNIINQNKSFDSTLERLVIRLIEKAEGVSTSYSYCLDCENKKIPIEQKFCKIPKSTTASNCNKSFSTRIERRKSNGLVGSREEILENLYKELFELLPLYPLTARQVLEERHPEIYERKKRTVRKKNSSKTSSK